MPRIHLFVHGRGQGHATRMLAVGRALLEAGFEVAVVAGQDAVAVLAEAFEVVSVASLPERVPTAARLIGPRVAHAVEIVRRQRSDLVVSDGDLPGVCAAKLLRRPCIAVGHGLVFAGCSPPADVDAAAWRREALKAWIAAGLAEHWVAVNFVDLPCRTARTTVASPAVAVGTRAPAEPGKVVCYFRDRPPERVLDALLAEGKRGVVYGREDPCRSGIEYRPRDRSRFIADLRSAEAVVGSAGSQLISECVALRIPFFGLHAARDDEQALNVQMLRAAGLGAGAAIETFDAHRLARFLRDGPAPSRSAAFGPHVAEVVTGLCRQLLMRQGPGPK